MINPKPLKSITTFNQYFITILSLFTYSYHFYWLFESNNLWTFPPFPSLMEIALGSMSTMAVFIFIPFKYMYGLICLLTYLFFLAEAYYEITLTKVYGHRSKSCNISVLLLVSCFLFLQWKKKEMFDVKPVHPDGNLLSEFKQPLCLADHPDGNPVSKLEQPLCQA